MKSKITHSGTGIIINKYEVRSIDSYGDTIEVFQYECKKDAMEKAHLLLYAGDCVAVCVELHENKYPARLFKKPSVYTHIAAFGDDDALKAGGWID